MFFRVKFKKQYINAKNYFTGFTYCMNTKINPFLNFKATFVSPCTVYKNKQKDNPIEGSIVEIDIDSMKDKNAVKKTVDRWWNKDSFGYCVYRDIEKLKEGELSREVGKVYAITLQQYAFDKLNNKQIIGLAEVTKTGEHAIELNFMQAEPVLKMFSNVGRSFIELLKNMDFVNEIKVKATYFSANFYEKMGFEISDTNKLIYLWKKIK